MRVVAFVFVFETVLHLDFYYHHSRVKSVEIMKPQLKQLGNYIVIKGLYVFRP